MLVTNFWGGYIKMPCLLADRDWKHQGTELTGKYKMAATEKLIGIKIILLLQLICFSRVLEAVICYDCTSWNPYCANSVTNPFPEAVATVECNITNTCFIRKEKDAMISRGCADWWMFSSVTSDYLGCQKQEPLWMKPQEWCFCDTDYCNGNTMDAIKQLNGQKHELHFEDISDKSESREKDESKEFEKKDKDLEELVKSSPMETTILPWWWWYVHWSTEKPYWSEGNDHKLSLDNDDYKDTNEQETNERWWKNGKVTKASDWWNVPAVPTGPVGIQADRQEDMEQMDETKDLENEEDAKIEPEYKDDSEEDFFCWDCYSDNPMCGEIVNAPITYYVGRVACTITQKCFVRKDNGVIYRGCADGWQESTIDHFYVGCRNQTMWDRTVEWCFCSSPYCNGQSIENIRNSYSI